MSDPNYDHSRLDRSSRYRNHLPPEPGSDGTGVWVTIALGIAALMMLAWFSIAPPQNTHETAANRAPLTEIETTGRSDRASPQIPRD
jgi:hypothetical protein